MSLKTPVVVATVAALVAAGAAVPATATAAPAAPKNIIVLIGDGMGYNAVDHASLWEHGTSAHQVEGNFSNLHRVGGTASQAYEMFPYRMGMSTYAAGGSYDTFSNWFRFDENKNGATDSAASATALATGHKTYNGAIGVDLDKKPLTNLVEVAEAKGKSTGVVSSVPFSHATPAGYVAHNVSRNNYHAIAHDMLTSEVDVVFGAGHPMYDNSHQLKDAKYKYMSETDWNDLTTGRTPFSFLSSTEQFTQLAEKKIAQGDTAPRHFGVTEVYSTSQQSRQGADRDVAPFSTPMNDVPTLETMTDAALNVLGSDKDGFFLMVEGGAIDWAGHANQNTRSIEETVDFNRSVEAAINWVETNSSWDETLIVVTADHETGYLSGPKSGGMQWTPMTGVKGQLPNAEWNSGSHTNQLVPFFAKGAGGFTLYRSADEFDIVRGRYIDSAEVGSDLISLWSKN